LRAQRFNGGIDAAAAGQTKDFVDHIALPEIEGGIRAHMPRNRQAFVEPVNHDDRRGTAQSGASRRAQSNRPLCEHSDDVADLDVRVFCAGEPGGHDVRAHQHLVVGQPRRDRREVGLGIRHQHIFGLGTVDGVAKRHLPLACSHGRAPVRPATHPSWHA
jgi:hypothetical protein